MMLYSEGTFVSFQVALENVEFAVHLCTAGG